MLKEERDKQFIENKFSNKIKEVLVCTFQPNLENSKHFHSKSNSQTTGSLYDRAVLWKEHQSKWVKDQLKIKEVKAQQEVIGIHIENLKHSRMYYDNMRLMHQNLTCQTHDGVTVHLKRQHEAQKAKEEVKKMLDSGFHRNVKRQKNPSRVTVPKKNNKKYMKEAMYLIKAKSKPSPDTNKTITSKDLLSKGFKHTDVIKTANDIEKESVKNIQRQFLDKSGIQLRSNVQYGSAIDTLHQYLHSFEI